MVVHPYICTTAIYSLVASKIYFNWVNEGSPQITEEMRPCVFSFFCVPGRQRRRSRSPGHEELAFGPCGRPSRSSRTGPCEWPSHRKLEVANVRLRQRRGHAINENVFRELLQKFIAESSQPDQIIPDFRCIFIGAPWVPFPKVHQASWVWSHRNQRGQVASCRNNQSLWGCIGVLCPKRRGNGAKHLRGTVPRHQAWIEDVPKQHSTRWHPKSA